MSESSTPPRTRGPYAKGIARRQEILERAIEVFAREGSDKTSLRSIARDVGVTHAALTHYFGSLEALLVAVYAEHEKPVGDVDPSAHGRSPVGVMLDSAENNREVPGLVQLYSTLATLALDDTHPAARTFIRDRFARVRGELADRVRAGQQAGSIRSDVDPEAVASLVIAASDGLQTQWMLDHDAPQDAALTLLEELLAPPSVP